MKIFYSLIFIIISASLLGFSQASQCSIYSESELSENDDFELDEDYESGTAKQKLFTTLELIDRWPTPTTWMTEREFVVIERDNNVSFDKFGDQMPLQDEAEGTIREKLVHTVGLTARVEWESVGDHQYTGAFKGGKYALVRFSPNAEQFVDDFRPSMGIKVFRDGQVSGNIFTMFGMLGQGRNSNPFWNDYTNHPPKPKVLAPVLEAFTEVSDFVTMMGLSGFADIDQEGNKETDVKFPFRIILHPSKEARNAIPNDLDMSPKFPFYIPVMQNLKFDTLFDVYAQDNPFSDDVKLIAKIKMKTPFVTSSYGDKKLFFKHTRHEEDLTFFPEWEDISNQQLIDFQMVDPVFFRPNLEFNH